MKTIFKSAIIVVFLNFLFGICFSQENDSKVFLANGDTLKGHIKMADSRNIPENLLFKSENDDSYRSYEPLELSGFETDGVKYYSAIVEVNLTGSKVEDLGYRPDYGLRVDTVFLRTLISGQKTLLEYRSRAISNFFIPGDNGYERLQYSKYKKQVKESFQVAENSRFVGQLTVYLNGCESLSSKIRNANYTTASLTKLFESYYVCQGETFKSNVKKEKIKLEYGVYAGAVLTEINFKRAALGLPYLYNTDFPTSTNFTIGGYTELNFLRRQGRFAFRAGLQYTEYQMSSEVSGGTLTEGTVSFDMSYLRLNTLFKYRLINKEFLNAYLLAGFSTGALLSGEATQSRVLTCCGDDTGTVLEGDIFDELKPHEQALVVGAGMSFGRTFLEYRYERSNGFTNLTNISMRTHRQALTVGYIIKSDLKK